MCSFSLSKEHFLRTEVPRESPWGDHQPGRSQLPLEDGMAPAVGPAQGLRR